MKGVIKERDGLENKKIIINEILSKRLLKPKNESKAERKMKVGGS